MKLIQNIKELPLSIFIECCSNQRYDLLILSGESKEDLTEQQAFDIWQQWINLLSEYYSVIEDDSMIMKYQIMAKISKLKLRRCMVDNIFNMVGRLRKEGLPYAEFLPAMKTICDREYSAESVDEDIRFAMARENNYKLELLKLEGQLAEMSKGEVSKAKEADFYDRLLDYEVINKVPVMNKESITTFMYALYMKRLNNWAKEQANKDL